MNQIANAPLAGVVVGRVLGYELTIGEYEDTQVLGQYVTEDEALNALGRYVMAHGREIGALYPNITPIGDEEDDDNECEGHVSTDGPIGNVIYCDGTCRPRRRSL